MIPINDIRGIDTLNYAKGERILRCKLASLYRVLDLYGWTSGIANYVSVSIGGPDSWTLSRGPIVVRRR